MYKKIFIGFLFIFLIGISLTGLLSIEIAKNSYYASVEERLKNDAYVISAYAFNKDNDVEDININQIQPFVENSNERITIINTKGKVVYDSQENIINLDNHKDRSEIKRAMNGSEASSIRYSNTLNKDMMYYAVPLIDNDKLLGIIRLSIPLNQLKLVNKEIFGNIIIAILIGTIIASLLGYKYLYYITKPINELTSLAKEISGGNFSRRITSLPKDELGELAISFNEMATKLQYSIQELKLQNIKLETVLDSMVDGIIAVDRKKNLMLINPAARELFGLNENEELMGKNVLEIFRNNSIYKLINKILVNEQEGPIEIEIEFPQVRILKISTNPIRYLAKYTRNKGVIIIIQDMTKLRKLENMRKDFAANVSHELKTPITSIKGFVETLRSGEVEDEKTRKRFLEIINFEAERLIRLVEDILTLSHFENNKNTIQSEKIKIRDTLLEVIQMMTPLANKKSIIIEAKIQENILPIFFPKDKFKQMMINIIDNSIKYTPNGGGIKIYCYSQTQDIVIKVQDNGIGIPKEDIPRLFERFYRVDKARSRSAGGTGLGLAIVKHIIQSMNGKIEVQSEVGKGTSFVIYIPNQNNEITM